MAYFNRSITEAPGSQSWLEESRILHGSNPVDRRSQALGEVKMSKYSDCSDFSGAVLLARRRGGGRGSRIDQCYLKVWEKETG
jgi:hypothetical protein